MDVPGFPFPLFPRHGTFYHCQQAYYLCGREPLMLAILHLGDIHVREGQANPVLARAQRIASAIKTLVAPASELYLVVAADISSAVKQAESEVATAFLADLEDALKNLQLPRY